MRTRRTSTTRTSGFTVVELALTSVILFMVMGALVQAVSGVRNLYASGRAASELQAMGQRALDIIRTDLRRSGSVELGGREYPYLFEPGAADADFALHDHAPAESVATEGQYDFGPDREIVLLAPQDADADGVPDLDATGSLVWSPSEIGYVVVTRADGVNYLERRVDGVLDRTVARHVERLVFDDAPSSNFTVPLGAIRARVYFRCPTETGGELRRVMETTVMLKNG